MCHWPSSTALPTLTVSAVLPVARFHWTPLVVPLRPRRQALFPLLMKGVKEPPLPQPVGSLTQTTTLMSLVPPIERTLPTETYLPDPNRTPLPPPGKDAWLRV